MWKKELISVLKQDLSEIKRKNPRYSLRAYSRKIGVGFGSLSDLINMKRPLSPQVGKKILERLALEKEQRQRFAGLIERDLSQKVNLLTEEAAPLIENWYYFAILNLLELDFSPKSVSELAERLGLPQVKVRKAIDYLVKWGFLKKIEDGYVVTTNSWQTTDGITSESVRKAHLDGLAIAERAVRELPVEKRDLTSLVFNGNSQQLDKVKIEIRKFLQKVHKIMSTGEPDGVYKINTQLFPIDQWNDSKTKTSPTNSGEAKD